MLKPSGFLSVVLFALLICPSSLPADESPIARWDFDGDADGWSADHQCRFTTSDGALVIDSLGRDPYCSVQVKGPPGWKKLSIRARFSGRRRAQLFWTTEEHPGTSEERSVNFTMHSRADGWYEYSVYFKNAAPLRSIRLDPDARRGQTTIDWIALSHSTAPPAEPATDPAGFQVPEGFRVELLYSVPEVSEGSWVSMAFDPREGGRLITCDQNGGLYRVTPPAIGSEEPVKVEPIDVELGGAQGMLWAFDSLYCVLNTKLANGPGLYRVTDSDSDGRLDQVRLLKSFQTRSPGAEHGPHGVVLGPDGESLYIVAGNMTSLPEGIAQPTRHQNWAEDQLLPRAPASNGHASGLLAPGGWVCRTDRDGKRWELIASGFRNPYDVAFNRDGELFNYDADMEMDIGTPWYRPTRVCHVVSGGEFGWRFGTGKWPAYSPDSLPAVVDVGLGSPTGVTFGYGTKFPQRYRDALFINDWTNGRMFAVHLHPEGASYTGELEPFLSGAPLPLTDLVVNPNDGAMYFIIGGRRTQSGLYRVTYSDDAANPPLGQNEDDGGAKARAIRRKLETYHVGADSKAIDFAWPYLSSDDRHLRYAARVALEHQDVDTWIERALAESQPDAVIQTMLAVARSGEKRFANRVAAKLAELNFGELTARQRLDLLRTYSIAFIRLGEPTAEEVQDLSERLAAHFPCDDRDVNHELCRLLVYLDSADVAGKAVPLMAAAATQEDRLFYGMALRSLKSGWTPELRREFFQQLNECETAAAMGDYIGGGHYQTYVQMFRSDAAESLPDGLRESLADVIDAKITAAAMTGSPTPRKFVRNWTVDDLLPELDRMGQGRSYENGKDMFAVASCIACHRFNNTGGIFGPDVTHASQRYSRQVLVREILEPSKQVSDQYEAHTIATADGKIYNGRILNETDRMVALATDPLKPAHVVEIPKDQIDEIEPAQESLMPVGLLNTLTTEDILDLLAYIESAGDKKHAVFQK